MARPKKRTDGYYTVTLTIGTDKEGKAKRKYFYSKISRKDAIAKRDAWMREHPYGETDEPQDRLDNLTVEEWTGRWMTAYKSVLENNSRRMYETNKRAICGHVFASGVRFGDMPLVDVKPLHINEYINSLTGYSKSAIQQRKLTITQIFDSAVENGLIEKSPVGKMPKVKGTYTGHRALTREEIALLNKDWRLNRFGLPALVMLWGGLRVGEVCGLKWENIDLDNDVIHVVEARDLRAERDKDTKTVSSVREVPIFPRLKLALATVPASERVGYFCVSPDGQAMNKQAIRVAMRSLMLTLTLDANGVDPASRSVGMRTDKIRERLEEQGKEYREVSFTAHDLRTTFATICYDAGVDVQTTAKWMGHSDITTTMKIYTKLSAEQYEESREKMERFSACLVPQVL